MSFRLSISILFFTLSLNVMVNAEDDLSNSVKSRLEDPLARDGGNPNLNLNLGVEGIVKRTDNVVDGKGRAVGPYYENFTTNTREAYDNRSGRIASEFSEIVKKFQKEPVDLPVYRSANASGLSYDERVKNEIDKFKRELIERNQKNKIALPESTYEEVKKAIKFFNNKLSSKVKEYHQMKIPPNNDKKAVYEAYHNAVKRIRYLPDGIEVPGILKDKKRFEAEFNDQVVYSDREIDFKVKDAKARLPEEIKAKIEAEKKVNKANFEKYKKDLNASYRSFFEANKFGEISLSDLENFEQNKHLFSESEGFLYHQHKQGKNKLDVLLRTINDERAGVRDFLIKRKLVVNEIDRIVQKRALGTAHKVRGNEIDLGNHSINKLSDAELEEAARNIGINEKDLENTELRSTLRSTIETGAQNSLSLSKKELNTFLENPPVLSGGCDGN